MRCVCRVYVCRYSVVLFSSISTLLCGRIENPVCVFACMQLSLRLIPINYYTTNSSMCSIGTWQFQFSSAFIIFHDTSQPATEHSLALGRNSFFISAYTWLIYCFIHVFRWPKATNHTTIDRSSSSNSSRTKTTGLRLKKRATYAYSNSNTTR